MRCASCSRVRGISEVLSISAPLAHGSLLDPLLVIAAGDHALNEDGRNVDLIRVEVAHVHQLLDFGDGDARSHAHHRREIARRLAEDEIAPLVSLEGADDRKVRAQRGLQHILPPIDRPYLFAFGDLRAHASRSVETADAATAGANALRQRPLGVQLYLQLAAQELPLELLVLAD